jgi:hypothetical protein
MAMARSGAARMEAYASERDAGWRRVPDFATWRRPAWGAPVAGGFVAGALLGGALAAPYYYTPGPYYPAYPEPDYPSYPQPYYAPAPAGYGYLVTSAAAIRLGRGSGL